MREEGSDETEVMETGPPGEPDRGKSARAVETAEEVDVPEEPEAWDSGSERGDDLEFEPDEEVEEVRSYPGDEERLKTRVGGTHDQSLRWRCRHPSVRDCAMYSRGRGWLAGGSDSAGGADSPDPPLHVLSEDKYGEVVLERLPGEVELPLFQELEEVKLKPSIFGLMCNELVVAPCIDLFALYRHHQLPRYYSAYEDDPTALGQMRLPMCGTRGYACMLTHRGR